MSTSRSRFIREYIGGVQKLLDGLAQRSGDEIEQLATVFRAARDRQSTIYICGNGGSAATASHFASDLMRGTVVPGERRYKAVALNDNVPTMLAWANDTSFERIFVEQLISLMHPEDVVVGISVSGNSENVLQAIDYATTHGGITIGLCGSDGGKLLQMVRHSVHISSENVPMVEDIHLILEHMLTSMLREESRRERQTGTMET